jgi:hypothetical protein
MESSPDVVANHSGSESRTREHLASWYTPGLSDGLGDRLLMFDNSSASSLELLRFRHEFTTPGFEVALRQRVEQLDQFQHPSLAKVRAVQWLGEREGLALISNQTPGRRLSEILRDARGPAFAMELLRQLIPVLAALHEQGDDIAHGALNADRIVVTPPGRLVVVEHVLSSALESLHLPTSRIRSELGLLSPRGDNVMALDRQSDIRQLAFIALSLLVGRRLDPVDYPDNITRLLDDVARTAARGSPAFSPLRFWLERALQLRGPAFESAGDALESLKQIPEDGQMRRRAPAPVQRQALSKPSDSTAAAPASKGEAPPVRESDRAVPGMDPSMPARQSGGLGETSYSSIFEAWAATTQARNVDDQSSPLRPQGVPRPPADSRVRAHRHGALGKAARTERTSRSRWVIATLSVVSVVEAFTIAILLYTRPATVAGATTAEPHPVPAVEAADARRGAEVDSATMQSDAARRSARGLGSGSETLRAGEAVGSSGARPASASKPTRTTVAAAASPAAVRSGAVVFVSPMELQVFERSVLLGSTSEPIWMTPGRHALDLVNESVGYRSRVIVEAKAREKVSLEIRPPSGRVSINALPWAEVWIDGKPMGETPLGNLPVSIGEHEFVFRHPQLGERRQKAVVRSDGVTRVSANMSR